ncbi:MAG: hypothetical protein ACTHMO_06455 [Rhodanobacteraceae bacterium]
MLATNEAIDRFVNWMFAGTGAVAGVLIANVNSVAPFLSTRGLYWIFILLGSSAVFGLLSKISGLRNKIGTDSQKAVLEDIKPLIEKHIQAVSFEEFLGIVSKTFVEVIPRTVRIWASYVLFRSSMDHLYTFKKLASRFQKQIIAASLQLILLIAVIFVAAAFVARGSA